MANTSDSTGWKTASDGSYKLMGYKYTPDGAANTAPGTAVLAVQGKAGESGGASEAKSQIAVQFRVTANATGTPLIPQTNPGLWARSFDIHHNHDAHANVLDSSGCVSGSTFSGTNSDLGNLPQLPIGSLPGGNHTPTLTGTMATSTQQNIPFPALPTYPTETGFDEQVAANTINEISDCARSQYPQTGDYDSNGNLYDASATTKKIYKYRVTNACNLPSSVTFGTSGNAGNESIIMYIDSSFSHSGHSKISSQGSTQNTKVSWLLKTSGLNYNGNTQIGSSDPTPSTASNWAFFLAPNPVPSAVDHYERRYSATACPPCFPA
jgi:hypothetical protein